MTDLPIDGAAIADSSLADVDATAADDERRIRFERSTWLLVIGVASAIGGLVTILLSIAGARPENMVYRQMPYLISGIAGAAVYLTGALLVGSYFLWRTFSEVRMLTRELEEAAAHVLWAELVSTPGGNNGAAGAPPTAGSGASGKRGATGRGSRTGKAAG